MQLANIELARIHPPKFLLRPVKRITIDYQELLDSIQVRGLWQPLLLRPLYSNDYELVDGNYRLTCLKQLRHETAPCIVRNLTDSEVLLAQLEANGIRPETSPVEFAERLAYILRTNPDMTVPQLARLVHKGPKWINKILRLNTANPKINQMVARGEIPVESACALARLPRKMQGLYIEQARILPVREFVKLARTELKRYREDARNAYIDGHRINKDKPVPYLRKIPEIKREFKTPSAAGPILLESEAKTPLDGWNACLAWILNMDPESLKLQNAMIEKRQRFELEAIEKRRQERKRLKEAREKAGDPSLLIDGQSFTPITEFGDLNNE